MDKPEGGVMKDWPSEDEWDRMIAGDYHDNSFTADLQSFIDHKQELDRLNAHRKTNWSQERLNRVLRLAIQMRQDHGQWCHGIPNYRGEPSGKKLI